MSLSPERLHRRRLLAHQRGVVRTWANDYIRWYCSKSMFKQARECEIITNRLAGGLEVVMRYKAGDAIVAMTFKRFCDVLLENGLFTKSEHTRALNPNLGA